MRLTATSAGFADATPIRPYKMVDFSLGRDLAKAIQLAEEFWAANRNAPINAKRYAAAIHALFLAQNPRLFQFEEFSFLYTALDCCFRLTQTVIGEERRIRHSDRIAWMCERFGVATPSWARKVNGGAVEVTDIRNDAVHEALFMGEPLGFALQGVGSDENLTLEMSALICRFLVALIGATSASYVRSPIGTRQLHELVL